MFVTPLKHWFNFIVKVLSESNFSDEIFWYFLTTIECLFCRVKSTITDLFPINKRPCWDIIKMHKKVSEKKISINFYAVIKKLFDSSRNKNFLLLDLALKMQQKKFYYLWGFRIDKKFIASYWFCHFLCNIRVEMYLRNWHWHINI